jgi:hypothetical protein
MSHLILAGRAPDMPKQQFTAVANGQQRSAPKPLSRVIARQWTA